LTEEGITVKLLANDLQLRALRGRRNFFLTSGLGASLDGNERRPALGAPGATRRTRGGHSATWPTPWSVSAAACGLLLALTLGTPAYADDDSGPGSADKSQYTLFNPTPERLMREFGTDRPDMTESPFTVDAGHIQFETNIFGFTRSRPDADGTVTDTYGFGETNMRIGLTNQSELDLIWQPYGIVQTRPSNPQIDPTRSAGIDGLTIRSKINLWGNDTYDKPGATALGLLPYVTLPTDRGNGLSNDAVEGGFILPFSVKLTDKFDLGINTGVDVLHNDDTSGYHPEYFASASLSYDWTEQFTTYYEIAGRTGTHDPRGDIFILATGFTYQFAKNLQFDAGVNFGVTAAADPINPFVGFSARF
jgi:Putative MetA-pathway of phenol degradation